MNATAILTTDWHLREDVPICRTDDFWESQWAKVRFIKELQKKHDCPVIHAGDLFHHWKPSPYLLSCTIEALPAQFCTVYGNHDLPNHALFLKEKCGLYTLEKAGVLSICPLGHWRQEFSDEEVEASFNGGKYRILPIHIATWEWASPIPGLKGVKATDLLSYYQSAAVIVAGHLHMQLTVREKATGHMLVNPGPLTRQAADKKNYVPSICLYFAKTKTIKCVELPYKPNAVSSEHLDRLLTRNIRLDAFLDKLNSTWKVGLSFQDNMERFYASNSIHIETKNLIQQAMDMGTE